MTIGMGLSSIHMQSIGFTMKSDEKNQTYAIWYTFLSTRVLPFVHRQRPSTRNTAASLLRKTRMTLQYSAKGVASPRIQLDPFSCFSVQQASISSHLPVLVKIIENSVILSLTNHSHLLFK